MKINNKQTGTKRNGRHQNLDHDISDFKNKVFVKKYPGFGKSDFKMCFSPKALKKLLETVGTKTPETGAKGFSPVLSDDPDDNTVRIGFDIIEYDEVGSKNASGAMYSPNVEWSTKRVNHHMDAEDLRYWVGDIHSHPGNFGEPSLDYGDGIGDLGYVRKIFETYPFPLDFFLLPIITLHRGKIVIHPWVIERENPGKPLIAEVSVCDPSVFPAVESSDLSYLEATTDGMYDLFKVQSDRLDEYEKSIKNQSDRYEKSIKNLSDRLYEYEKSIKNQSDRYEKSIKNLSDRYEKSIKNQSDRYEKSIKNLSDRLYEYEKSNKNSSENSLGLVSGNLALNGVWGNINVTSYALLDIPQEKIVSAKPSSSLKDKSKNMEGLE